uniref:Uncharacterized protein n=1 Tax=Amphora coffeiformis TaxID=265554 RepID=A0A7S3L346_9STRA
MSPQKLRERNWDGSSGQEATERIHAARRMVDTFQHAHASSQNCVLQNDGNHHPPTLPRSATNNTSGTHVASDLIATHANDTRASLLLPNIYGSGSSYSRTAVTTNHGMTSLFQQVGHPDLSRLLQLQQARLFGRLPPMGLVPQHPIDPGFASLLTQVGPSSANTAFLRPDTLQALREQSLLSMQLNNNESLLQRIGQTYRHNNVSFANSPNPPAGPFLAAAANTAAAGTMASTTAIGSGPRPGYQGGSDISGGSRGRRSLPVILAHPGDHLKLSAHQVFLRKQIEAFRAGKDETSTHTRGRNKPICIDQVGIRCRHCAHLPISRRQKGSTYFPSSLQGIYQASQNMSTTHMQCGLCDHMPNEIKNEFSRLLATKVSSSGAGRPYWAESAASLGLVDTEDGIRFVEDLPPKSKNKDRDRLT